MLKLCKTLFVFNITRITNKHIKWPPPLYAQINYTIHNTHHTNTYFAVKHLSKFKDRLSKQFNVTYKNEEEEEEKNTTKNDFHI